MKQFLSVIIPTYNRRELVSHTVDSALQFIEKAGDKIGIVVVDDASDDGTSDFLQERYHHEIANNTIKLIRNEKNLGVTGAKNAGAEASDASWLLFLDSDDLLIPDTAQNFLRTLKNNDSFPLVFFRCLTLETGMRIGPYQKDPYPLTLKDLLNIGTPGECLPVAKSSVFAEIPYNSELRGCEGLTYARIIRKFGPARVETLAVRKYRTKNNDRLCSGKGIIRRSCYIAKYHNILLTEFLNDLYIRTAVKTILKIIWYQCHCVWIRLKMVTDGA